MELSINAIITLVIGMLVLSLGLGMITNVLAFGGGEIAAVLDGYRLEIPASQATPLVNADPIRLENGASTVVFVNFYNKNTPSCDVPRWSDEGAWLTLSCPQLDIYGIQTLPIDIPVGEQKAIGMRVDLARQPSGSYPCSIRVYCEQRNPKVNQGLVDPSNEAGYIESRQVFVVVG